MTRFQGNRSLGQIGGGHSRSAGRPGATGVGGYGITSHQCLRRATAALRHLPAYSRPTLRKLVEAFLPMIKESCRTMFMTLSARSTCSLKLTSASDGLGSPEGWL